MATHLQHPELPRTTAVTDRLRAWRSASHRLAQQLAVVVAGRQARPLLGMIGAPLAAVAAVDSYQWWVLVPVALLMWWWVPRDDRWYWWLAVQEAAFGVEWSMMGAYSLGAWPARQLIVGAWWIAGALVIALLGVVNRRARSA